MKTRILTELCWFTGGMLLLVVGMMPGLNVWGFLLMLCGWWLLRIYGTRERRQGRRESLSALEEWGSSAEAAKAWEAAIYETVNPIAGDINSKGMAYPAGEPPPNLYEESKGSHKRVIR